MKAVFATAMTALVSVSLYGCGSDSTTAAPTTTTAPCQSIVELAQATADLSTLTGLLVNHSLVDALSGPGPFTVFAPTNEAFTAAGGVIATLTDDQITDVLKYHVVPGVKAEAVDLTLNESLATFFTDHNLTVASLPPTVMIKPEAGADATVTTADVNACNGVVHIVNAVLVPDLGPAPPAPAPAPTPASNSSTSMAPPAPAPAPATMDIVALAQSVPELSTLVGLLVNESLVETLQGPGPFTVFAPNNDAFTAATDVIAQLTNDQVKDVLLYHVVTGVAATAAELTVDESLTTAFPDNALTVATLQPSVTIHPDGAGAADATVVGPNNMATNGVVHIVDAVLVPNLPASFNFQVV